MSAVQMEFDVTGSPLVKRRKPKDVSKYERIEIRESVYDQMLRSFNEFNARHPEILVLLADLASSKMKTDQWQIHRPPIRINMLWEVLRDDLRERGLKIGMSNNLKPFYARKLIQTYPSLRPYMEVRNQFSALKQKITYTWIEVLIEKAKKQ